MKATVVQNDPDGGSISGKEDLSARGVKSCADVDFLGGFGWIQVGCEMAQATPCIDK